jgi:hypothetical protein
MNGGTKVIHNDRVSNPYKLVTRRIDSNRIRLGKKKEIVVYISSAKEMHIIKDNSSRAGAIIYTHLNGQTLFCLGVDTESKNLTDFGGGVKKEETLIEGGLRELYEESQGVFGDLVPTDVEDSIMFHTHNMGIMFIEMEVDPTDIETEFQNRIKINPSPEVCGIAWLTTKELVDSIQGKGAKMYIRVKKLLNQVTNIIEDL